MIPTTMTPAGSLADAPRGSQGDTRPDDVVRQMETELRARRAPTEPEQLLAAAEARVRELEGMVAWLTAPGRVDILTPRAGEVHVWMYGSNRVRPDRCVVTPSLEECVRRAKAMGIQEGR